MINKIMITFAFSALFSIGSFAQFMVPPGVPVMPGAPPLPMPLQGGGNFANSSSFVKSYSYGNIQTQGQPIVITGGGVITPMPAMRTNTVNFTQSNYNQNINTFRRFR